MGKLIFEQESYKIRGAIFEVYKELGSGFLEAVYQEALGKEFTKKGLPFESQKSLDIFYKGEQLRQRYIADFICFSSIIVEIKALKKLFSDHEAQLMNYLKAAKYKLGFLVNFGAEAKVEIKRMVN